MCGSIAHADPSSELPLALAVSDGEVVLRSARGERVLPASEFQQDMLTTAREADELVAAVRFPVDDRAGRQAFTKWRAATATSPSSRWRPQSRKTRRSASASAAWRGGRWCAASTAIDDAIGAFVTEWADELEGYEDLHASAALRRDLFKQARAACDRAESHRRESVMRRVNRDEKARVTLTLNGRKLSAEAEPRLLLTDFLRHALGATGTHVGCEHGICGCCTVLIDGVAQRACLTLAVQVEGREVTTVEVAGGGRRHAQSAAAGVPQQSRAAMRLLHAGHPDVVHRLSRAQSASPRRKKSATS